MRPNNKDVDAMAQSFCNNDEHHKAIELIISMMRNGNSDIVPLKQPEVMTNGTTLNFIQYS